MATVDLNDLRGPVAKLGRHPPLPEIRWLIDMSICIDDGELDVGSVKVASRLVGHELTLSSWLHFID
jgi:hypothetical protein